MDLDQFKVINDTCGHIAGDELLRQLAVTLKGHVRESDTLARLGGDEFALLLECCRQEQAEKVAQGILEATTKFHFSWEGNPYDVGMSIGLVVFDHQTANRDEILVAADMACYQAKESGRNRVHVYRSGDQAIERRHGEMQWVSRIKQALDDDAFVLFCQEIEPLQGSDSVRSMEILIRLVENVRQPG